MGPTSCRPSGDQTTACARAAVSARPCLAVRAVSRAGAVGGSSTSPGTRSTSPNSDRAASAAHHPLHFRKTRLDLDRPVGPGRPRLELLMIAGHDLRILQHMSGEHGDHPVARADHALADQPPHPGRCCRARRLAPDPGAVYHRLRLEDLVVAYRGDDTVRVANGARGALV